MASIDLNTDEHKTCRTCGQEFRSERDFFKKANRWRLCEREALWFNCLCGSTLMIPKGKYPWYSPEKHMSSGASSLFNRISKAGSLPHIPTGVMELQKLISEGQADARQIATTLRKSPSTATEVLRAANNLNALRNPGSKIGSLEHAVGFIGEKTLSDIIVAASVKSFTLETKTFDAGGFWEHGQLTANIAESLIDELGVEVEKDEAFLAGYLCNVGKIVGALCYPAETDAAQSYVDDPSAQSTWERAELEVGLPSHRLLGEIGGALWGMPEFIIVAATAHHQPSLSEQADAFQPLLGLVALANILAHWIRLEPSRMDSDTLTHLYKKLGLNESKLEALANERLPLAKLAS